MAPSKAKTSVPTGKGAPAPAAGSKLRHIFSLAAAIAAVAVGAMNVMFWQRNRIPSHLLGHPLRYYPELLTAATAAELLELAHDMREFPTITSDLLFYKTRRDSIGEDQPAVNGSCSLPFLLPTLDHKRCTLPGRVDVGRHYVSSGGFEGLKEKYETSVSRVQSFSRYMFNFSAYPVANHLFESPEFMEAATAVCPKDKQVLRPLQFNLIAQVPGQTVATHTDAPYFWGFDRFDSPQWLLAVMVFSGLFQDIFIDQVQVVAYFHTWRDDDGARGGRFVYWDDGGLSKEVWPHPRSASTVDGSKTVHAATVFMPEVRPPLLDKSKTHNLQYVSGSSWDLISGDKLIAQYNESDLRFSIVYRAQCFASAEAVDRFNTFPEEERLTVESVLETLTADLVRRGRISQEKVSKLPKLDLALLLMDEFIKYPLPETGMLPLNYCALPKMLPVLAPIFNWLPICK